MLNKNKINLVCVGSVGESFFQFLENEPQLFNTLLLHHSDEKTEQKEVGSNDLAKLIFCVLGASSTKNVLKIKSLFDHNPTLWQKTHFILVHPFKFEGEDRSKTAKNFSEFVTFQGSTKVDFRNEDLKNRKFVKKDASFEEAFEVMNQWILSEIKQKEDLKVD